MIRQTAWLVRVTLIAALLFAPLLMAATQNNPASVTTPHLTASLISKQYGIIPGQPFWVALHFNIIPHWHTYWKNPGDSGTEPRINWQLPQGFTASDIHWPYPQRFPVGPLMNYGYSHQAMQLVKITPPATLPVGQSIELIANAEWLVCKVECIPEEGTLKLSLPIINTSQQSPTSWADAFSDARQRLPQPLPWPASVDVNATELTIHIDINALMPASYTMCIFIQAVTALLNMQPNRPTPSTITTYPSPSPAVICARKHSSNSTVFY